MSPCFSHFKAWLSSATSSALHGCCVESLRPAQWRLHRETREVVVWPTAMCACPVLLRVPPTLPAAGSTIEGAHSLQTWDLSVNSRYARSFVFQQRIFHWMSLSFVATFLFGECVHVCGYVCQSTGELVFYFHHGGPGDWTRIIRISSMCPSLLSHLSSPMVSLQSLAHSNKLFWPPTNGLFLYPEINMLWISQEMPRKLGHMSAPFIQFRREKRSCLSMLEKIRWVRRTESWPC